MGKRKDRICAFPGCGRDYAAKGLCKGHYQQGRNTGKLGDLTLRGSDRTCTFPGCTQNYSSKGLCQQHYYQKKYQERKRSQKMKTQSFLDNQDKILDAAQEAVRREGKIQGQLTAEVVKDLRNELKSLGQVAFEAFESFRVEHPALGYQENDCKMPTITKRVWADVGALDSHAWDDAAWTLTRAAVILAMEDLTQANLKTVLGDHYEDPDVKKED